MKKNLVKKLFSTTVALCTALGLAACGSGTTQTGTASQGAAADITSSVTATEADAAAAEYGFDLSTATKREMPDCGITLLIPPEYDNTKGFTSIIGYDMTGDGVYWIQGLYGGITDEEYASLQQQMMETKDAEVRKEIQEKMSNCMMQLFEIGGITKDRTAADFVAAVNEKYGEEVIKEDMLTEIKKYNGTTYFRINTDAENNYDNLEQEYKDEYDKIAGYVDAIIANAEYSEPTDYSAIIGTKLSFETKDIDGNTITSEELFAAHEVTMVNVWATWCHWCIEELPQLQKINGRLARKNCAIVGLLGDGTDDETIATGKGQLAEAGVTYTCILPYDGWENDFDMNQGWPTSFMVNKDGIVIAAPIVGADIDAYETTIEMLLAAGTQDASQDVSAASEAAAENIEDAYKIYVKDTEGVPVVGAMVQFCTDATCNMAETDENGLAAFALPEGVNEVHILKAPAGYKPNEETYKTEATYGEMTIVLEKE